MQKNLSVSFFPSDATLPALATAEIPASTLCCGALQLMCQALADDLGKDGFVCAVIDGTQMASAWGREQRDLLDVLKT